MSIPALTWAYKQDIRGPAKAVLVALANRANESGICFPSVPTIGTDAGVCVRSVQNSLKRLTKIGAVVVKTRKWAGGATSSTYQLPIEAIRAVNQPRHDPQGVVHEVHHLVQEIHHPGAPDAPPGAGAAEEPSLNPQIKPSLNRERVAADAAASAAEVGKAVSAVTATAQRPSATRPATSPPATRLPEDWQPNESGIALARDEGLDFERTLATFRCHWKAASGSNARKHDWDATWANWCRREADRRPRTHASTQAGTRPRYETVSERRGRDLKESMRGNRFSRLHRHEAPGADAGGIIIEGEAE